ncbi:MAG TPA: hypothetical protein VLA91_09740 [Acidimicrobiia bacterium]|nr:hypothetical protein [Acidimicrobiia bacterium]
MIGNGGWTDTNSHEPGRTILKVLAYTLIAAAGATAFALWRTRRNAHHRDTTG